LAWRAERGDAAKLLGDAPAEAIRVGADNKEIMKRKLRQVELIRLFLDTFVEFNVSFVANKFFLMGPPKLCQRNANTPAFTSITNSPSATIGSPT